MKPIGGYFELELSKGNHSYHTSPYVTKSGRASLRSVLNFIKPSLVYIPYYTCNALLEPFEIAGVNYRFYTINELLEPASTIDLLPGEYLLYINYFDLKRDTVNRLSKQYEDKLIVDCTQAFFMKGNGTSWFFNSCRKFFGVPDGSYLYVPDSVQLPNHETRNERYITDHLLLRFNGHANRGYGPFLENEQLAGGEIAGISRLSEHLLSQVDYKEVAEKRKANYAHLHSCFRHVNLFPVAADSECAPMCYPLLLNRKINKTELFSQQIFIPTFWQDTLSRINEDFDHEKNLTEYLLPLPADHRYNTADMDKIANAILPLL